MKSQHSVEILVAACLLLSLLPLTATAGQETAAALAPIDADLLARLTKDGTADLFVRLSARADLDAAYSMDQPARGEYVWRALQQVAEATQAPVLAYARRQGLEARSLAIVNAVFIPHATLQTARGLAALPGVAGLSLERATSLPDEGQPEMAWQPARGTQSEIAWGIADIHAPELWSAGVRGAGVKVAAIDTGVQWDHPALVGQYGCPDDPGNPACWFDPGSVCGGLPCDDDGHGTFDMGLMAADDDPGLPYTVGVAPDVTWIACKACEDGSCSDYALIACAQWVLAPGGDPANAPHVVAIPLSWGSCHPWFEPYVSAWTAAGIAPVSRIGSNGPACASTSGPGDYANVVGVGAYDSLRTIASFSSRGPSSCAGDIAKPNLVAPGVEICSTYPGDGWSCSYSGTSMAASYAAGGLALILSACPQLAGNLELLMETVQASADEPPDGNCGAAPGGGNYTYGHGYLNVTAAGFTCGCCDPFGTLEGQVTDQAGTPLQGIAVTAVPEPSAAGTQAITDPDGHYSMELLPGSYAVSAGGGTCLEQTVPGVVVTQGQTTLLDFSLTCQAPWQEYGSLCFDWTRFDGEYLELTGKVYFLGGRSGASTVGDIYVFDPATGACADTGADMPVPVSNYTANFLKSGPSNLLCTFGGRGADGVSVPEVQCYDPVTNSAYVKTVLPPAFDGFTPGGQAVVDNQAYVFGGLRALSAPYTTAVTFRYDPQANSWTQLGDLGLGRGYIAAAAVDGKVYAFGGDTYDGASLAAQAIAERLDPAAGTWDDAAVADLPAPSGEGRAFSFEPSSGYLLSGLVVLAGGGVWPEDTAAVLTYDLAADSYDSAFPDLNVSRRDHAGFFVPGTPGRMWVVGGRCSTGGCGGDNPPYAPAEYYEAEPIVLPTMHVAEITGQFAVDPFGRILLRSHVRIVDEADAPVGDAAIKALITSPGRAPAGRTRITRPSGYARFHWGCNGCSGTWELCVHEVGRPGYQYEPGDNVVTCQTWQN